MKVMPGDSQWHLLKLTRLAYLNCIYGKAGEKVNDVGSQMYYENHR